MSTQEYVDCPHCGEVVSTPDRVVYDGDDVDLTCQSCCKEFTVQADVEISFYVWPLENP